MLEAIFQKLSVYKPTLVGTYPLGLQVQGSDFDIICEAQDLEAFAKDLLFIFEAEGHTPPKIAYLQMEPKALVSSFTSNGLKIEVFCQTLPVTQQKAFRHMIVEGRLLVIGGDNLREKIRREKSAGVKTEPAFAKILGLLGNPYDALLQLESYSDAQLSKLVHSREKHVSIELYSKDREALRELFREADSGDRISSYIHEGVVLVAKLDEAIVGHLQLLQEDEHTREIKNMAVSPLLQGLGIGLQLINAAIKHCKDSGVKTLTVSTAAAGVGQLRFYQRAGFRMLWIERDAFIPETGYPTEEFFNGILLRDQVWFSMTL